MRHFKQFSAIFAVLLLTSVSHADTLDFVFNGPNTISFSFPSSLTFNDSPTFGFFQDTPVNVDGDVKHRSPAFSDLSSVTGDLGGFSIFYGLPSDPNIFYQSLIRGPQLFTVTGNIATFLNGTFTLSENTFQVTGANAGRLINSGTGTLTITDRDAQLSTVPEPSTFALLTTGLLGGVNLARRRGPFSQAGGPV